MKHIFRTILLATMFVFVTNMEVSVASNRTISKPIDVAFSTQEYVQKPRVNMATPVDLHLIKISTNYAEFDWWYFGYDENGGFALSLWTEDAQKVAVAAISFSDMHKISAQDGIIAPDLEDRDKDAYYYISTYWILNNTIQKGEENIWSTNVIEMFKGEERFFAINAGTYYLQINEFLYDENEKPVINEKSAQLKFNIPGEYFKTIYLDAGVWALDGATLFAHTWSSESDNANVQLVKVSNNIYSASIKAEHNHVLFVRMQGGATEVNWNTLWNKTIDLIIPADKNEYVITGFGESEGYWKVYGEDEPGGGEGYGSLLDSGKCGSNLTWEYYSSGVLKIIGTGGLYNYNLGGPPWWDYHEKISTIILPDGLTATGVDVFVNCNISSISIPETVIDIEEEAFSGCKLTSLSIPKNVANIYAGAFSYCEQLTSITCNAVTPPAMYSAKRWDNTAIVEVFKNVDKNIPLYVPKGSEKAYKQADQWKDFVHLRAIGETEDYIDTEEPVNTRTIYLHTGGPLFWSKNNPVLYIYVWTDDKQYTNVKLEHLQNYLFSAELDEKYTNLMFVKFDSNTTSFDFSKRLSQTKEFSISNENNMFTVTCDLLADGYDEYADGYWSKYDETKKYLIAYGTGGDNLSWKIDEKGVLTFSGSGKMNDYSFYYYTWSPWYGYSSLVKTIVLPNGLTHIGAYAFSYFDQVTSVTIPSAVKSVGTEALNIQSLTSLTCNAIDPPQITGEPIGKDITHLGTRISKNIPLKVPKDSKTAYEKADYWKDFTNIQAIDGSGEGGDEKPGETTTIISVAEAITRANALGDNETEDVEVTVKGYVVNAQEMNWAFKTQIFWLADDKTNSKGQQFKAYHCYAIENGQVMPVYNGDQILLTGKLKKFVRYEEVTLEIDQGTATFISKVDGDRSEPEIKTITVSQALSAAASLAEGAEDNTAYHIEGYVTQILENDFNTDYKNMTFWMADSKNGASSNAEGALCVYRGKPDVELVVGDKVRVTTSLQNYKGTLETATGPKVQRINSGDPDPEKANYMITVLASDSRLGTVKGGGTYEKGDKVTLSATAGKGARFARWSDGVTSASRTITVSGDATYMAIFLAIASNNSDKVTKGYNNYAEKSGVVEPTNGKGLAPKNAEQSDTEEETTSLEPARKIFQDGHIYILRDGKVYSLTGMPL